MPSSVLPRALALLLGLSMPMAHGQTLTVTAGSSRQQSRTVSFDGSTSLSGFNLVSSGPLNSVALQPVDGVMEAELRSFFSSGASISGSLEDVQNWAPQQQLRHGAGSGLLQMQALPGDNGDSNRSGLSVGTRVPAVTGLGLGESRVSSTSFNPAFLSVFR